jgi:signal transduction histidine kinase
MDYKIRDDDRKKKLGSGMGLWVVSNITKKLGGEFILQSK